MSKKARKALFLALSSLALAGCIETTSVGRPIPAIAADPIAGLAPASAPSLDYRSPPFDLWEQADVGMTVRWALVGKNATALRDVDLVWTERDEVRVQGMPATLPPHREGGK